jgi:surface polysaccharide O-acyltransferase-like enzyme
MIAVVFIHVTGYILTKTYNINTPIWNVANVYNSLSRWCVPVYIMISGALLLQKDYDINVFFKKRISKVVIPFIAWSFIFYVWSMRKNLIRFSIADLLKKFVEGNVYYHLWFFYIIIALYLITPFIRVLIKNASDRMVGCMIAVWFLNTAIIPMINKFLKVSIYFNIPMLSEYLGYFILGYYINKIEIKKIYRIVLYMFAISSVIANVYLTRHISLSRMKFEGFFYNYLSLTTIVTAAALFVLFKYIEWQRAISNIKTLNAINYLSSISFGVYLIHAMFLDVIKEKNYIEVVYSNVGYILGMPIITLIIISLSVIAVYIIKKLPYIKLIIP